MRNLIAILIIPLLSTITLNSFAGAWTQEKGKGYAQLSFAGMSYSDIFIDDCCYSLKRKVSDVTLQAYLEHGLSDNLTFIGVLPFKMLSTGDKILAVEEKVYLNDTIPSGSLSGISNMYAGLKYKLHQKNWVWSTSFRVGTASAQFDQITGLRTGYDSWIFHPSISAGHGWAVNSKNNMYFSAESGYQIRTNGNPHYFIGSVELGYSFFIGKMKTWVVAVVDANIPLSNGSYNDLTSVHTGLYHSQEGNIAPGGKAALYLKDNISLNLATFSVLWSRYGARATIINVGLALEY